MQALFHLSQAGRDGEEEMACSGLFSHERLAAVAMRASVTGSPLYAGLCGEERWCRPFGDGLRQDEEEMCEVRVCSAVDACVCEYNKSEWSSKKWGCKMQLS